MTWWIYLVPLGAIAFILLVTQSRSHQGVIPPDEAALSVWGANLYQPDPARKGGQMRVGAQDDGGRPFSHPRRLAPGHQRAAFLRFNSYCEQEGLDDN